MTLYTERQCLKSLKEDEGAYWRNGCSCVTEKDCTDLCNKCSRSACFCEAYAMIAWVWLCKRCKFAGCLPVELTTLYDHTTNSSSVATDEFCCGMNNDICAVLNRSYEVWCCKCIIYNKRNFMFVSDFCKSLNIYNIRIWVSKSLNINSFCVLLDRILHFLEIEYINKCCCDSVCRKRMLQKVCCTAVNIFGCYNVISLLCKILDRVCDSCCTGCYCKCCGATLKCCDPLLEYILCRVCKTSVNVTGICKSETCCCMIAVAEYIGRCLVDWYCSCICNRIRLFLSYVKL